MRITFYGAAQTVTGSKHIIDSEGYRILLDCGLHQGEHNVGVDENRKLKFDASTINSVILSHAHIDHCGMLPVLAKGGFKGKIYCTGATKDIAKYLLLDSAAVQAQDYQYLLEHANPDTIAKHVPIYNTADVELTMNFFETVPYFHQSQRWTELNERIRFKFYEAGHILGSAITLLEIKERTETKTLAFTGDIGQSGAPLLHDPEKIQENTTTLISEATYGSRDHKPLSDVTVQLRQVMDAAIANKAKILVPAFALGRTQELIYIIHNLIDKGELPRMSIYVDSPLAMNLTEVFMEHKEDFDEQASRDFTANKEQPLAFKNLQYISSVQESKDLNKQPGPLMIIASSGMMEGGRILHHLKNEIENKNNTILITGYQAENSLGRKILDGISPVTILGEQRHVNARVINMDEFSAHGDKTFLLNYISSVPGLKKLFLVHTEPMQARGLKESLGAKNLNIEVIIPNISDSFEL